MNIVSPGVDLIGEAFGPLQLVHTDGRLPVPIPLEDAFSLRPPEFGPGNVS